MTTAQPVPRSQLHEKAVEVLRGNDLGTFTKAGPNLYPHQWTWDAAFISIGWAHLDQERATQEWRTMMRGQWSTGMYPHIVFSGEGDYFPGFNEWDPQGVPARPAGIKTSGITQPPVHGFCLERMTQIGDWTSPVNGAFLLQAVDSVAAFHDWLLRERMDNPAGLVEIHHGWESGMDNSPRFDSAYARVTPVPRPMTRTDTRWADSDHRPTTRDYERYMCLVDEMATLHFDDRSVAAHASFRIGDVFATACLAMSADSLANLAQRVGRTARVEQQTALRDRARAAVGESIDAQHGLARDFDILTGQWLSTKSLASFSSLIAGGATAGADEQLATFLGDRWIGHTKLTEPLLPSISPEDPTFNPTQYWRGPIWPIMNWLFGKRIGSTHGQVAEEMRQAGLRQLSDLSFAEYYNPFTGDPLGGPEQSWTAMAAIDWTST